MEHPLISVVTVVFNAVTTIEKTILSVINQTYTNIEYIIIDGGSTDGTVDIIKKYADRISYWVSEPDKGIYDAMNKGIAKATGEWINFMNAGDCFYDAKVLDLVFLNRCGLKNVDVIYGNRVSKYERKSYVHYPRPLDELKRNFNIFHQSTFVRTSHMKKRNFDNRFRISGDFDFFHQLYICHANYKYADVIISICDCSYGVSSLEKYAQQRIMEDILVVKGKIGLLDRLMLYRVSLFSFIKEKWLQFFPSSYNKWRYYTYDKNPYMKKI